MLPSVSPKPYRENIPHSYRQEHRAVDAEEINRLMLQKKWRIAKANRCIIALFIGVASKSN